MKSQASLVRTKGRVVLNTVAPVYLHIALVIFPDNAELYDTFGNRNNIQGSAVFRVLCEKGAILERADELWDKSDKAWGEPREEDSYRGRPARTRALTVGSTWLKM